MSLVECVPNFSEGRRHDVIAAIRGAAEQASDVHVLDVHTDRAHNRTVLTMAGGGGPILEAAFASAAKAVQLIDLERHRGIHPRMGAVDVIPLVPLGKTPMDECVRLARLLGQRLAAELDLPVYLYGQAAVRPERRLISPIRNRGYERLKLEVPTDPELAPDFGPPRLGPAGAVAVGARDVLIAFNVNLASGDVAVAHRVAAALRESAGGLPSVQALGMPTEDPGIVQVSMNLLDYRSTPLWRVFEALQAETGRLGVSIVSGEVVGLAPAEALAQVAAHSLAAPGLGSKQCLEARLLEVLASRRESLAPDHHLRGGPGTPLP